MAMIKFTKNIPTNNRGTDKAITTNKDLITTAHHFQCEFPPYFAVQRFYPSPCSSPDNTPYATDDTPGHGFGASCINGSYSAYI